jgi:hypothetical protein
MTGKISNPSINPSKIHLSKIGGIFHGDFNFCNENQELGKRINIDWHFIARFSIPMHDKASALPPNESNI